MKALPSCGRLGCADLRILADLCEQYVGREWFGEEVGGTCGQAAYHDVAAGVPREHDDGDGSKLLRLLEPARHLHAVLVRQHVVHEDECRPDLAQQIERLEARANGYRLVATTLEDAGDDLLGEFVVVDDEDLVCAGSQRAEESFGLPELQGRFALQLTRPVAQGLDGDAA